MKRKKPNLKTTPNEPLSNKECEAVLYCLQERSQPAKPPKVSDTQVEYQLEKVIDKLKK